MNRLAVLVFAVWSCAGGVAAQTVDGHASITVDTLPGIDVAELRARVCADYRRDLGSRIRLAAAGFVEGLVADRNEDGATRAAIVRPQALSLETTWEHADVRIGFSRVVWGRLDEFLPTDVVNPQDLTKFFFEGRSEGRMPVAMMRTRWLPSEAFTLETIYVPFFRSGRFDELDERTAPLAVRFPFPVERREPPHTWRNAQGGLRATATTARVDWSLSAYRGFEPLPVYDGPVARFPRYTMIGADFETVKGQWGVRGEIAAFIERTLQVENAPAVVEGQSVEAGVGVDRQAGVYRVSTNVVFANRMSVAGIARRDLTLVASLDRSFARETRTVRLFAAYNPGAGSTFARAIGSMSVRDNVALEASGGLFTGSGDDVFARFSTRDFLYLRLRVFY